MSDFPSTLVYFEAFVLRTQDDTFGKTGEERVAYGGVLDPARTPMSQREYETFVRESLDHYRTLPFVVRIETRRFRWDGRVRRTFRRKGTK